MSLITSSTVRPTNPPAAPPAAASAHLSTSKKVAALVSAILLSGGIVALAKGLAVGAVAVVVGGLVLSPLSLVIIGIAAIALSIGLFVYMNKSSSANVNPVTQQKTPQTMPFLALQTIYANRNIYYLRALETFENTQTRDNLVNLQRTARLALEAARQLNEHPLYAANAANYNLPVPTKDTPNPLKDEASVQLVKALSTKLPTQPKE